MIAYRFGSRDLLRVRFATSPLIEVFSSFDALRRPDAHEGAAAAFAGLHEAVRFEDDVLRIDRAYDAEIDLDGHGLLLVPSVFVAPEVWAMTDAPWQPSVIYP